ncbi:MAG: ABC transporter ATP-binding protein [Desulfurococcales archaeon]|nr:ABC transporter ATP-binding protein [Desulfurococcales archaeon]
MEEVVRAVNLESGYGETQVLFGITIRVRRGELTAILGSNGVGKSTTLWTLIGVLPAWKGNIYFKGEDITRLPTHERVKKGMILVPEGRRLWPDLTVREHLELAAANPRASRRKEENLELVYSLFPRLKERREQKAGSLSGGEQQMLAIARGLMLDPEVLMLDEPSLGLAPKLVQDIMGVIARLKEEGRTILLVEQNVHLALMIADYAYIMENGRITIQGTAEEVRENPNVKKAYLGL